MYYAIFLDQNVNILSTSYAQGSWFTPNPNATSTYCWSFYFRLPCLFSLSLDEG